MLLGISAGFPPEIKLRLTLTYQIESWRDSRKFMKPRKKLSICSRTKSTPMGVGFEQAALSC
jgi:hypothetical protein